MYLISNHKQRLSKEELDRQNLDPNLDPNLTPGL